MKGCDYNSANDKIQIAIKAESHVDSVLYMRQVFLKRREKEETERAYLEMAQNIDVEWDQVKTKIAAWAARKSWNEIYFFIFLYCHFISVLLEHTNTNTTYFVINIFILSIFGGGAD